MNLSTVQRARLTTDVIRLSRPHKALDAFREMGISGRDLEEAVKVFKDMDSSAASYVRWVFDERGQSGKPPTRYTDGSHPVLYTALTVETAFKELVHWLEKSAFEPLSYRVCVFRFEGDSKDLVSAHSAPSWLVGNFEDGAYGQCLELAKQAIAERLDALRVPSARDTGGQCLPIFSKDSVTSSGDGPWVRLIPIHGKWSMEQAH